MARPTTKEQLQEQSTTSYEKLINLIASMSPEAQEQAFSFEDRDKCVRDVLVHLYEWHQLLLKWTRSNLSGKKASFLPPPYNWKTYPEMNVRFWEQHQTTTLNKAKEMLAESHEEVTTLIESFSNEELFTSKHFSWTGTTSLGAYCVSATSSHYDWAIKKLRQHVRSLKA